MRVILSIVFVLTLHFGLCGQNWKQIGSDLSGNLDRDQFGFPVSVSANGKVVAVAAPHTEKSINGHSGAGYVKTYRIAGNTLIPHGQTLSSYDIPNYFGYDIQLNAEGNRMAVSLLSTENGQQLAGCVKIFEFKENTWQQLGQPLTGYGDNRTWFGASISLNPAGDVIAIGTAASVGYVRVYRYVQDSWIQIGSDISGVENLYMIGGRVKVNSDSKTLAVGFINITNRTGNVKIFKLKDNEWSEIETEIPFANPGMLTAMEFALSDDGNTLAVLSKVQKTVEMSIFEMSEDEIWTQKGNPVEINFWEGAQRCLIILDSGNSVLVPTLENKKGFIEKYTFTNGKWEKTDFLTIGKISSKFLPFSFSSDEKFEVVATGFPFEKQHKGIVKVYRKE